MADRRTRHVRKTLRGLFLAATLTALAPATAHADRSYTARYATTDRGQVALVANTLETCPASAPGCAASQAGTATTPDNSQFSMSYVDVDADSATFDSSRATLALPAGATVLWAGLYWAGDTSAGLFGAAAPTAASRNQVRFATPTTGYAAVTASVLDADASSTTRFQGFADVTAQVKAAGNGTYAVANVQSGTGINRWAGWSPTATPGSSRDTWASVRYRRCARCSTAPA